MSLLSRIRNFFNGRAEQALLREGRRARFLEHRRAQAHITAGSPSGWRGTGGDPTSGNDELNQEYMRALGEVLLRAQDLDVNNPDVRGFHRTRTAQVLGKGVAFKADPHHKDVGLSPEATAKVTAAIGKARETHSRLGGFDASGRRRSEGKQQERAFLTMLVTGSCLVHRVWRRANLAEGMRCALSLEVIAGSRISTPYDKLGDPLVSYGVRYADEHRSRVAGYYIRRVSTTIGNSFVPDYTWDYIPVEDAALLELTEIAGIDRSLPLSVANVRMLRNRGEFLESTVESARAQSKYYCSIESPEGADPYTLAADDTDVPADPTRGMPMGFTNLGGGVLVLYNRKGEQTKWNSARLPDPDFTGFVDKSDERLARGFSASLSRFTRKVNNSWAGGRLEDQQDDPIVDQLREAFVGAWQQVHEWFVEALFLADAVEMPGYNVATRVAWTRAHATFPGKVHINPVQTAQSRSIALGLRTATPQQFCEEDGLDLRDNLEKWAKALAMAREVEKQYGLEPRSIEYLLQGKALSSASGAEIAPPAPEQPEDPETEGLEEQEKERQGDKEKGRGRGGRLGTYFEMARAGEGAP